MDKIPYNDKPTMNVTVNQRPAKVLKKKSITGNTFILLAVSIITALIMVVMFSEYSEIDFDFSLRSVTVDAVMIAIGIFSIGFLMKQYSINENKKSEEYSKAKSMAEQSLSDINVEESSKYIEEYCETYSKKAQENLRRSYLEDCGLTYEEFLKSYIGRSIRDIVREEFFDYCISCSERSKVKLYFRFYFLRKDRKLTRTQLKAIHCANLVKYESYDPDFLRNNEWEKKSGLVPSSEYDIEKENRKNNLTSVVSAFFSVVFGAYFAGSILFDFSVKTLISALIKLLIIFFNVVTKYLFGRKLVVLEISRYHLKTAESKKYAVWLKENKNIKISF
jgi:hypothetical protein